MLIEAERRPPPRPRRPPPLGEKRSNRGPGRRSAPAGRCVSCPPASQPAPRRPRRRREPNRPSHLQVILARRPRHRHLRHHRRLRARRPAQRREPGPGAANSSPAAPRRRRLHGAAMSGRRHRPRPAFPDRHPSGPPSSTPPAAAWASMTKHPVIERPALRHPGPQPDAKDRGAALLRPQAARPDTTWWNPLHPLPDPHVLRRPADGPGDRQIPPAGTRQRDLEEHRSGQSATAPVPLSRAGGRRNRAGDGRPFRAISSTRQSGRTTLLAVRGKSSSAAATTSGCWSTSSRWSRSISSASAI